jgi:hypothetical protein
MTTTTTNHYLTDAQLDEFWQEGFLLLKGILTAEETATAKGAILNMVPRDLVFPEYFGSTQGRLKPYNPEGTQSFYTAELLPLLCNEKLYGAAADILESEYLSARDGSVGISLKDGGSEGLIQRLHLDMRRPEPEDLSEEHLRYKVGIGGCYYLSDVEENGAGIHVIPQGPRMAEEIMLNEEDGLTRFENWRNINELAPSIEVTGEAGDFVLMHHMMPHGASRNKNPSPRIAQFSRMYRMSEEDARVANGPDKPLAPGAEGVLTELGRKLFGLDPWVA